MSTDTTINGNNPNPINNPVSQNEETKVQASTNGRKMMVASRYVLSGGLAIAAVVAAIALTILFAPAALAVVGTIGVSVLAAVAGATAIVTAAVACGLFFGGKNIQAKADAKAEAETKAAADAKAAAETKAAAEVEAKAAAEKKAKAEARAKILAAATPETIEEMVEDLIQQAGTVFQALDDKSSKAEKYGTQVTALFAEANATEVFETLLKAAESTINASPEELENARALFITAKATAKQELTRILTEEAAKAKAASDVPPVVDAEAAAKVLLKEFNTVARGYRDAIALMEGKSEEECVEIKETLKLEYKRVGQLFQDVGETELYRTLFKDAKACIDAPEDEQLKEKFIEARKAAFEIIKQKFLQTAEVVEDQTASV